MKWALTIAVIVVASLVGYAYSHQLLLDLRIADSIGEGGLTAYRFDLSFAKGPSLQIGRAINSRLDIWMDVGFPEFFSLRARALLVDRLGPLSMSVDLSRNCFTFLSALFLGPIQIDLGRDFSSGDKRWVSISVSPNQFYSLVFGVQFQADILPFTAVRIFPHQGTWGFSIYNCKGQWRACLGGTL
jgi:hypothetical protein